MTRLWAMIDAGETFDAAFAAASVDELVKEGKMTVGIRVDSLRTDSA